MEAEIVLTVLELVPWTRGAGRLEGSKGGLDIHTHTKIKKKGNKRLEPEPNFLVDLLVRPLEHSEISLLAF